MNVELVVNRLLSELAVVYAPALLLSVPSLHFAAQSLMYPAFYHGAAIAAFAPFNTPQMLAALSLNFINYHIWVCLSKVRQHARRNELKEEGTEVVSVVRFCLKQVHVGFQVELKRQLCHNRRFCGKFAILCLMALSTERWPYMHLHLLGLTAVFSLFT